MGISRAAVGGLLATILVVGGTTSAGAGGAPRQARATTALAPGASRGEWVGTGSERAFISRDHYGVPHIASGTTAGMWFASGWAQAEDRLVQLELTRRGVEGTLSQLFGPSELSTDESQRLFFYTQKELSRQYDSLPAAARRALVDYSAGINAFVARAYSSQSQEQASVPEEFWALGVFLLHLKGPFRPGPWLPTDTIAIGDYLARSFGGGGGSEMQNLSFLQYLQAELAKDGDSNSRSDAMAIFDDARWTDDTTSPTTVPATCPDGPVLTSPAQSAPNRCVRPATAATAAPAAITRAGAGKATIAHELAITSALRSLPAKAVSDAERAFAADRKRLLDRGEMMKILSHGGSNAYVVAPWRSGDHHALLWGAPQEGFGNPSVDCEEYLHGPGYDAAGMCITGEPFILIGHNANASWTTTSEETVDVKIYVEHMSFATNPPRYWFNGKWTPVQVVREQIPINGARPATFTIYRTIDGPVFSSDAPASTAFSADFASWNRETGSLLGFSQLGGDQTLPQFAHSMSLVTTLHNFFYADRQGNIAYFGDGLVPVLPFFNAADPRLPYLGDGTQQWKGLVPFSQMPHSINPGQGYLDNWNTKPSPAAFYQQNGGDEYWGTIFRSALISRILGADKKVGIGELEQIQYVEGTIDDGDNTRPAAPYFIPFLERAYQLLFTEGDAITNPSTHPDLEKAVQTLVRWNGVTTIGSPAMSIFAVFLHALADNVFGGGVNGTDAYVGKVNFNDGSLGMGTYGGLGGMATYNLLYHILAGTSGVLPCGKLCYAGGYFAGQTDRILVESLNDTITILSGKGPLLGEDGNGFGTADIAKWGWVPGQSINWDSLDPIASAAGVKTHCGTSASQNRSTFFIAMDMASDPFGQDLLPPGESSFINIFDTPSPHMCDQVGLFNDFHYKQMALAAPLEDGYRVASADGAVHRFGDAAGYGSLTGKRLNAPIVSMAATPDGHGYWLVARDGGVFAFGDAPFFGSVPQLIARHSLPSTPKPSDVVAIVPTPDGHGYWLVSRAGAVYAFGDAGDFGSVSALALAHKLAADPDNIVSAASTPDGHGYVLAGSDGAVYGFGDARYEGSIPSLVHAKKLASDPNDFTGLAMSPDGLGYAVVARNGGVFAFGDEHFVGSCQSARSGCRSVSDIVGMVETEDGLGYRLVGSDGGVFAFGAASFHGSLGGPPAGSPAVVGATETGGPGLDFG